MKKSLLLFIFLMLSANAWAAPAMQYSAYVETVQAGQTSGGKLYMDGNKIRIEATLNGQKVYSIVRPDLKKLISVIPNKKVYIELPISDQDAKMLTPYSDSTPLKEVGEESINGQNCIKYKIEDSGGHVYLFINKENQAPVLMTAAETDTKTTWKDLKLGAQNSKLFEAPSGYKKLEAPEEFSDLATQQELSGAGKGNTQEPSAKPVYLNQNPDTARNAQSQNSKGESAQVNAENKQAN